MSPDSAPRIGLDHLTFLDTSPVDLVSLASDTGYDLVGIRLLPLGDGEPKWPMSPGSAMLRDTLHRLADTDIGVLDVECAALGPHTAVKDFEPALAAGAELGAAVLNVLGDDSDRARLTHRFAELVDMARDYSILPALEPIPYRALHSLEDALAVVRAAGGGCVLVDALHFQRYGGDFEALGELDESLIPHLQICDAPIRPPATPECDGVYGPDARRSLMDEARTRRLPPGDGELPLSRLLAATPSGIPLTIEAPSEAIRRELGDRGFASYLRKRAGDLVGSSLAP